MVTMSDDGHQSVSRGRGPAIGLWAGVVLLIFALIAYRLWGQARYRAEYAAWEANGYGL
jgi:hypothetical protein